MGLALLGTFGATVVLTIQILLKMSAESLASSVERTLRTRLSLLQEKLERAEIRLEEAERVTSIGLVVATPDPERGLVIVRANLGMQKLFGYSPEELVGMPVADLVAPEDRERHLASCSQENGPPGYCGIINYVGAVRRDGTTFPVMINLNRVTFHGEPAWTAVISYGTSQGQGP